MVEFIPDLTERNGKLYYIYPDGRLILVPDDECEIFKPINYYHVSQLDDNYLRDAWYDNLNPLIEKKCSAVSDTGEKCGNVLMRHIIMQGKNIYICQCGNYIIGDSVS